VSLSFYLCVFFCTYLHENFRQKGQISDHKLPFKSAFHLLPDLKGPLLFPGKIASFTDENEGQLLAISDTGNNRILVTGKCQFLL